MHLATSQRDASSVCSRESERGDVVYYPNGEEGNGKMQNKIFREFMLSEVMAIFRNNSLADK